jgi:hypothetical protein
VETVVAVVAGVVAEAVDVVGKKNKCPNGICVYNYLNFCLVFFRVLCFCIFSVSR